MQLPIPRSRVLISCHYILLLLMLVWAVVLHGAADIVEDNFDRELYVDHAASGEQTGSAAEPFASIGQAFAVVDANRNERIRVRIAPGTYREGGLLLWHRTALLVVESAGPGKVVVSGSDVWTDWQEQEGVYHLPWPYTWGLAPDEHMQPSDEGKRCEMVFVDGILYQQVLTHEQLRPGAFLVLETTVDSPGSIYVQPLAGVDMETALVEVGIRRSLLSLREVSNFVLRGMVFQHSVAGPMHSGDDRRAVFISGRGDDGSPDAMNRRFNENFLIQDCDFQWNNAGGLTLANAKSYTLHRVTFAHNGRSGLGTNRCQNVLWDNVSFVGNNWRMGLLGGTYGWDPAGVKLLFHDSVEIRDCSFVGNFAAGLWIDYANTNVTARRIRSTHNWKNGVYYEANTGPFVLEDSLVRDNAFPLRDNLWDGGILIAESINTLIRRSFLLHNNYYAIGTRNRERFSTMYWVDETHTGEVKNITLQDSVVVGARTEPNLKNFPSNFTDGHFNGGAIVSHTQTQEAHREWFGLYSAATYTGSGNRFFHDYTDRLFSRVENTGFGFQRLTVAEWTGATGQDSDSVVYPDWERLAVGDAFIEADGLIVIEAENTTRLTTAADPHPWEVRHGFHSGRIGHTGWGYLAPAELEPADPDHTTRGHASYRLRIRTPGTYTLALRYRTDLPEATSPAIVINGESTIPGTPAAATEGRWQWLHGPQLQLERGNHILALARPEVDFAIDRIVLAQDINQIPVAGSTELGPAESALGMPVLPGATPFTTWLAHHFDAADLADPLLEETLWGPDADPDGDGIVNLLEFVLGGDPALPGSAVPPAPETITINGNEYLRLTIVRNPDAASVAVRVESAATLAPDAWASGTGNTVIEIDTDTLLQVRDAVPITTQSPRFLRIVAEMPYRYP